MNALKCMLVAAGFLMASGNVQAAEKSILGLELGMKGPRAMDSLAPAVREGADVLAIPHPTFPRYRLSSKNLACRWTDMNQQAPCIALIAFGKNSPDTGSLHSIRLEQFFDTPLDFAAFEQRIKEAYGAPAVSIALGHDVRDTHAYWLWSNEPFARTEQARKWASNYTADVWDVSEPGVKFAEPVLHLSAYVRRGQVRGMRVILFDPAVHHAQTLASRAWIKKEQEEKDRRAKEDAKTIQLR